MKISNTSKPLIRPETKFPGLKAKSDPSPPIQDSFEAATQVSALSRPDSSSAQGGGIRGFLRSGLETAKAVATILLSGTMVLGGAALMSWGLYTGLVPAVAGITVGGILAKEGVKLLVRGLDEADRKKTAL